MPKDVPLQERLLLRVSEAAQLLSISRSQAYELVARGVIPSVRLGGKCIRVPRHALETWVGAIGKTPSQPATAVGEPANGR